ncbi:hypothetical protein ACFE04_003475 [Oxalis oulophora]
MDDLHTPRTVVSFNAMLYACVQSKCYEEVPLLFVELPDLYDGIVPDKISYGILVRSYCELGQPEKALEVLVKMEDEKKEITTITYTTIMNSFYKKGMIDEAEKVWAEMLKSSCQLDVAAYNVRIMNAIGEDVGKVKDLIDEMGNFGLTPDTISYNAMMTCYCRNGNMEEAKKVFEGLEGFGCKPNAASFRTLIYHLCRNGEYEDGYKIFKQSVAVHKISDFGTLKHLAEGLVKTKRIKEAKELFRTLKKKFHPDLLSAWMKVEKDLGLGPKDEAGQAKCFHALNEYHNVIGNFGDRFCSRFSNYWSEDAVNVMPDGKKYRVAR